MKIMSVIPAAAASSTAYWISGLSTMGSISLGLALVAGKKRVPRPATGNTALVIFLCMMVISIFVKDGFCRLLNQLVRLALTSLSAERYSMRRLVMAVSSNNNAVI